MARWPAEPIEPTAKVVLSPLDFAYAISDLMSVTGRSLAIATDSGALATSEIGTKSFSIPYGTSFIVIGAVTKVEALKSSVYPSGGALATTSPPMMPLPPGRFSTTNGWPIWSPTFCASARPSASSVPPGGNGMTIRTGRLG